MLFCQALVACSLPLGACCLWLFIFFIFQLQVVPGSLCSESGIPMFNGHLSLDIAKSGQILCTKQSNATPPDRKASLLSYKN